MYELISIFVLAFGYCRDIIEERAYDKGFGTLNMYLYQEDFMVLAAPSANKDTLVFELKQPEGKETVAPLSTAEPPES